MNDNPSIPIRLRADGAGIGAASQQDIERRAEELARIDGRDHFTDVDLSRAASELAGGRPESSAPETTAEGANMTQWDDAPDVSGRRVDSGTTEDDATVAERLIQDGLDEADHRTRVEAEEESGGEEA